ncbi:MAG: HdeD family acid-resistance protein [Gaiellaceae bacterium]
MSSLFQQAEQMAETQLTKVRWALGLSGALSVALGVVIIVWPGISLFSLVIVFGAFAFARGIVQLGIAISGGIPTGRGWLAFSGLAGIAVGVLVFLDTGMSALALLYVIGAYAIVLGAIAFGSAFVLPLDGGDSLLLAFTGLISILFGVVIFAKPGDGAVVLLSLIAAYALIIGVSELGVAIGGKRLFASAAKRVSAPAKVQTSH